MRQRITIGDVAKAAGVSKQTVSRAINDKGEISRDTKERIMEVVRELGYRPSRLAQAMNTQRSLMVGLVIPDITNPFFPEVARGVQDAAFAHNYNALICNSDHSHQVEIETLEMLAAQGVDGLILFANLIEAEVLTRFANTFRPIVIINRDLRHPNVSQLMVDNSRGAMLAVDHFVEQGHRAIGMLTNADLSLTEVRRVQGFRQGLANHSLGACSDWISADAATMTGGYDAAKMLLSEHPETTAIFCYNDLMALGAIRACRDLGRRVPEDISIVGFDNIQITTMVSPALSTIDVDKYQMGKLAFERVLKMVNDASFSAETIDMDTQLIVRESSGRAPS